MKSFTILWLSGIAAALCAQDTAVPPGAAALGYTKCIINERPTAAHIAPGVKGNYKWFSGEWYFDGKHGCGMPPTLDHYATREGLLAMNLGGDLVSAPHDFSAGILPLLPGPEGFYVEFEVRLSGNDKDHWPAVWLMPAEHSSDDDNAKDHYAGDSSGMQRWQELDVDEGGFGPGMTGTAHNWNRLKTQIVQHDQNPNNVVPTPLDRSQKHIFGLSFDPKKQTVTWWLDGTKHMSAGAPSVAPVAVKQHFYLIMSAQTHGAKKPYTMFISGVRAYVPPSSKLPAAK
ncbi:MAG: hypothetical protein PHC61_08320 [Chitinivibrionales bacterium]|nr:hypothetical protein [Chitinivibrionales bacterium]